MLYVYTYTYTSTHVYFTCLYIYVYLRLIHVHIYIYIHRYVFIELDVTYAPQVAASADRRRRAVLGAEASEAAGAGSRGLLAERLRLGMWGREGHLTLWFFRALILVSRRVLVGGMIAS